MKGMLIGKIRKKWEAEINQSTKSHEEETQLRLKFENKLNGIYSGYRELQGKVFLMMYINAEQHERALKDIKDLLEFKKNLQEENAKIKESNLELQATISNHSLKLLDEESKIKFAKEEIKISEEAKKDLTLKLAKEEEILMRVKLDMRDLEKEIMSVRLAYEAEKEKTELGKKEYETLVKCILNSIRD